MSIFGSIASAIFGHHSAAPAPGSTAATGTPTAAKPGAPTPAPGMNIWLHEQVMTKLAETGGVVPPSLSAKK
jgi:hypothetical protein